jgi:hypothetical protein
LKHISLYSSLNITDGVSQPCRATDKIIVLYILIFIFLDSRREDKRFWTELWQALPKFSFLSISPLIISWFVNCCSQIFQLCHIFKQSVSYLCVMICPCILVTRQQHVLSFLLCLNHPPY